MTVDWDGYEPYVPLVRGPLHLMSRQDAARSFAHLIAEQTVRIDQLRNLLDANGTALECDGPGIQKLNDWFRLNVEGSVENPGRLRNLWYAVVNDLALFLGDVIIHRSPTLHWAMFTAGKKNISYQRPVIMGFTKAENDKYHIDIDGAVGTYGHRIVGGDDVEPDLFQRIVSHAREYA